LQTEDAGVLERAACELEGVMLRQRTGDERANETGLGAACGFGLNSQIGLGVAHTHEDGLRSRSLTLGGKTQVWRGAGEDAASVTLAWALVSSRHNGGWKQTDRSLKLVTSMPIAWGTVHFNLSREHQMGTRLNSNTWGLAFEHGGIEAGGLTWAPMVELVGASRESAAWNVAVRATVIPERFFLDSSWGQQTGGDKARLFTLGFKLAFWASVDHGAPPQHISGRTHLRESQQ
jgi:hypothetical protein